MNAPSLRLKALATVTAGQSPPSDDVFSFTETSTPFLQGNAEFGSIHPDPVYQCHNPPRLASPGDLLVSVRAPVGAVNLADRAYGIGRGLVSVRPHGLSPRYAWWLLQSSSDLLNSVASGSTFLAVSSADIANLRVPVSERAVQQAIADYLDVATAQIDAFIARSLDAIELLAERRLATIRRATTLGVNPPAVLVDSRLEGVGPIAPGWQVKRLSWLFRTTASGTTPAPELILDAEDADVGWVTTGELRERPIHSPTKGVPAKALSAVAALKVHPAGSLLVAMYGATIGRTAILRVPATSNQAVCALSGPTGCSVEFVEYALLAARERLLLQAVGGGQPNINQESVRAFRIPVPEISEQIAIVRALQPILERTDAAIATTRRAIDLARERRAALISAAVTGKIDVGEAA